MNLLLIVVQVFFGVDVPGAGNATIVEDMGGGITRSALREEVENIIVKNRNWEGVF